MPGTSSTGLRYVLYPLLLATTLLLTYAAVQGGWDLKHTLWAYLLGLLALLIALERSLPMSPGWGMTRDSFLRDLRYLLTSGITIAVVRGSFGALALWLAGKYHGPLAQVAVVPAVVTYFLVFEFFQYWFHRLSHSGQGRLGRFLWRVHVAHHLPDRVYVVMHGVFHPLGALFTAVLVQAPMFMLGLSPQAVFAATLLIDLQTMVSHFNVDVRAGLLNYVFVGTELHRYHHSARLDEAKNYGSVIPLWDLVFGTFRHRPGQSPTKLGLDGSGEYPPSQNLRQVLALPFRS